MCDFLASIFSEEAAGHRVVVSMLSMLSLRLLRLLVLLGASVDGGTHPGGGLSST